MYIMYIHFVNNEAMDNTKTKITISVPEAALAKVRHAVPRGKYSEFFIAAALRELERQAKKRILALRGKIVFDLDWKEMERIELKHESK